MRASSRRGSCDLEANCRAGSAFLSHLRYDLCVITRELDTRGRGHLEIARAALRGGATMLQLRDKRLATRPLLELATTLQSLCRAHGATFIVNDRVDIALACGADGVHLGEDDMPLSVARGLLGPEAILGASVDNPAAAREAAQRGADYLGVGPVFPTGSKSDAGAAIGLAPIGEITRATRLPLLAIGGLTCDNITSVIQAGASGIAVISTVAEAEDMEATTRGLLDRIRRARESSSVGE